MKGISKSYAERNKLSNICSIIENDMSKVILIIERLKENKDIKYYIVEMILFNQLTHKGQIKVSFLGD